MYKRLIVFSLIIITIYSSCSKDLKEPGDTSAVKMANEWWVTLTVDGDDVYSLGHQKIATYNTSENKDSIWIDDYKNIWPFKAKAAADFTGLTFTSANSANAAEEGETITITEGKILPKVGVSKTGIVTDSIYMKVEFSDDPGTVYVISGHARTRWIADDY